MSLYRLTFLLPQAWTLLVQPGRQDACLHRCIVEVQAGGVVKVQAPERALVFEQARRFLRPLARDRIARNISGIVEYMPPWPAFGGRDTWHIVVNSEITFSPSRLDPTIDPGDAARVA